MNYGKQTYTILYSNHKNAAIDLTSFLNHLHEIQLDMIDEATEKSDMRDAKELLKYIMEKK